MRKNRLIALIGTLTMAAAGLAAVSAGVSSKKAESVSAATKTEDASQIYVEDQCGWCFRTIHMWDVSFNEKYSTTEFENFLNGFYGARTTSGWDKQGTSKGWAYYSGSGDYFIRGTVSDNKFNVYFPWWVNSASIQLLNNDNWKDCSNGFKFHQKSEIYAYGQGQISVAGGSACTYAFDAVTVSKKAIDSVSKTEIAGSSIPSETSVKYNYYPNGSDTPSDPSSIAGYTFDGWYTDSSLTNPYTSQIYSSDTTIYAKFIPNATTYTINFDAGEGEGSMSSVTPTASQAYTLPSRSGQIYKSKAHFDHWSDGLGNEYADAATIPANRYTVGQNVTLTANYRPYDITDGYYVEFFDAVRSPQRFKLTWNEKTGSESNHFAEDVHLIAGDKFKVVKYEDEQIVAGQYFGTETTDMRNHAAITEGQLYKESDTSTNLVVRVTGDYDIYYNDQYYDDYADKRIWIPANSYTVVYDANGGSGTIGDQTAYFYDDTTDVGKGFAANVYGKSTFTAPDSSKIFDGWSTNKNATKGELKPGDMQPTADKVPNPTSGNSVTLYAIWRNKTVADGHYIEGTIGGTSQRIEGTLDTTNNQIVFDSIQFSEGDHFKVVTYTNEVPAWSGFSQVDAKDGSARKENQVVEGNKDDIAINTGDAGTYTIYYHHEGYASNKVYIPALYTVTWKNYDNSILTTEKYGYTATPSYKGATPTKPSDASYEYSFSGWNPAIGQVLADTTYTAKFSSTAIDYDITYVTEGTLKSSVQTTYNCDAAVTLPVEADFDTKPADSTFVGWYNDADFEDGPVTSIPLGSTGDKTFYGKWEGKVIVTYVDDSGSREIKGFAGATLVEPTVTARPGYTADWEEHLSVFPNSAKTINASYTANTYEIIFNSQGGSNVDPINATFGQAMPDLVHKINKTGHDFLGFFDQSSGGTKYYNADWVDGTHEYYSSAHVLDIVGDDKDTVTLYAQWQAHDYTVHFNLGGAPGTIPSDMTLTFGKSIKEMGKTLPDVSNYYPGHTFAGWYLEKYDMLITDEDELIVAEDITLTAHWTTNSYAISFDNNGGQGGSVSPTTYSISNVAQTITITAPTKLGNTASYDIVTGEGYSGTAPSVSGNIVTIPANSYGNFSVVTDWTPITPSVTINIVGGSYGSVTVNDEPYSEPIIVPYNSEYIIDDETGYILIGEDYTIVANPKTSTQQFTYSFDGWDGVDEYGNITEDVTITATFSVDTNQYAFEYGDGDYTKPTSPAEDYYDYGTVIQTAPVATKEHCTLEGWYTDASLTHEVTFPYTITDDVTLYPKFEIEKETITITINGNYGVVKDGSGNVVSSIDVPYESTVEFQDNGTIFIMDAEDFEAYLIPVANDGGDEYLNSFTGWTGIKDGDDILSDITITANFSQVGKPYTLSWNFDGGTPVGSYTSGSVAYGTAITYPTDVTGKTGYTFAGWDKTLATMPAEATEITAIFTANSYNVTFNANGGKFSDETTEKIISETYDSKYQLPADPSMTGYTFAGWFTNPTDGTQVTTDTDVKITSATTLYAHWTPIKYDISFIYRDTDGTIKTDVVPTDYDKMPEGPTPESWNDETYSYRFTGWEDENGNAPVPVTGAATYTAQYEAKLLPSVEANRFITWFNEKMAVCDKDGHTDEQALATAWNALWSKSGDVYTISYEYNGETYTLSNDAKLILSGATGNPDGNPTEKFAFAYDYICGKYNLENFLGRNIHLNGGTRKLNSLSDVPASTWIIASVAIVGIAAVGVFFIYRKRKEN